MRSLFILKMCESVSAFLLKPLIGETLGYRDKQADLKDCSTPGINDSQGFVFTGGAQDAALTVPAHAVYQVWMGVTQLVHQLPGAHIPHTQDIIAS